MNGEQALDALMQDAGLCTRCGFSRCQCEPRKRGNPNFRSLADDERTVRVMVSMPASLRDWLREQPGSSDSERVREVLEAARDHEREMLYGLR